MVAALIWFGAFSAWESARIWKPYDQHLSFSGSRLVSHEFEINTVACYAIHVYVEYYNSGSDTWPVWVWEVVENGRIVAKGSGSPGNWEIGRFRGHKGRYVLTLEPNQGTVGSAIVGVEECGGLREAAQFWLAVSGDLLVPVVTISVIVFFRSIIVRRLDARDAVARAASWTQPGSPGQAPRVNPVIRHPWERTAQPRPSFMRPSWYGFILLVTFFVAFLSVWLFNLIEFPIRARG